VCSRAEASNDPIAVIHLVLECAWQAGFARTTVGRWRNADVSLSPYGGMLTADWVRRLSARRRAAEQRLSATSAWTLRT